MGLAADAGRECEKVYEHLVGDSGVRTYCSGDGGGFSDGWVRQGDSMLASRSEKQE